MREFAREAIIILALSACYSWLIGDWLKGMTLGPLVMVIAAMIVEWYILGSGDGKGGR